MMLLTIYCYKSVLSCALDKKSAVSKSAGSKSALFYILYGASTHENLGLWKSWAVKCPVRCGDVWYAAKVFASQTMAVSSCEGTDFFAFVCCSSKVSSVGASESFAGNATQVRRVRPAGKQRE